MTASVIMKVFNMALVLTCIAYTVSANDIQSLAKLENCLANLDLADTTICRHHFDNYFDELDVNGDQKLSSRERDAMFAKSIDDVVLPIYFPEGSNDVCSFDHFCDMMVVYKFPELPSYADDEIRDNFCAREQAIVEETCQIDWNVLFPEKANDPNDETALIMTKGEYREVVMKTFNNDPADWDRETFLEYIRPSGMSSHFVHLLEHQKTSGLEVVRMEDYTEPVNCIQLPEKRREMLLVTVSILVVSVVVASAVGAAVETVAQGGDMEDFATKALTQFTTNAVTATCCTFTGMGGCLICGSVGGVLGGLVGTGLCEAQGGDDCFKIEDVAWNIAGGALGGAGGKAADMAFDTAGKSGMALLKASFSNVAANGGIGASGGAMNAVYNDHWRPKNAPPNALVVKSNTGSESNLGACEGECDNDDHCAPGLKCFQRSGFTPVPGCSGAGQSDYDYCYDPTGSIELSGPNDSSPSNLEACTGECDYDYQCAGSLKCFQRSNGETIPGCVGSGAGDNWDYCYDPDWMAETFIDSRVQLVSSSGGRIVCAGLYTCEGQLQLRGEHGWLHVCDDYFDKNNNGATVACKELGYQTAAHSNANTGNSEFYDDVICTGSETSLFDCPRAASDDENCGASEGVQLTCSDPIDCSDISGTWLIDAGGDIVLTKTSLCSGGVEGHSWTWTSGPGKVTLSDGTTGDVSEDGNHIKWSNGYTYTKAGFDRSGPNVNPSTEGQGHYVHGIGYDYLEGQAGLVYEFKGSRGDADSHMELYITNFCNCPVGVWNGNTACTSYPCVEMHCVVNSRDEIPNAFQNYYLDAFAPTSHIYRYILPAACEGRLNLQCTSNEGWTNNDNANCHTYTSVGACSNGAFNTGFEWTGSPLSQGDNTPCQVKLTSDSEKTNCAEVYNYPAQNCCDCGKPFHGLKRKVYMCDCPIGWWNWGREAGFPNDIHCVIEAPSHVPHGYDWIPHESSAKGYREVTYYYIYTLPWSCEGEVKGL